MAPQNLPFFAKSYQHTENQRNVAYGPIARKEGGFDPPLFLLLFGMTIV
jgi:hypothetical protein